MRKIIDIASDSTPYCQHGNECGQNDFQHNSISVLKIVQVEVNVMYITKSRSFLVQSKLLFIPRTEYPAKNLR